MSGFSPGVGFCPDPQAEVIREYYTKPRPLDSNDAEITPAPPVVPEICQATPPSPTPFPVPEEDLLDYEEELAPEGDTADDSATRTDSESDELEIVRESTRDREIEIARSYLERLIRERGAAQ